MDGDESGGVLFALPVLPLLGAPVVGVGDANPVVGAAEDEFVGEGADVE